VLTTQPVPFFSGAASIRRDWESLADRITRLVRRGVFVSGPMVAQLEEAIKLYTGAAHAVACNSGTDALIMTLRAAGLGMGDEVIVPAYTFFASVSSVIHAGARPVLVDIQPGSYAIDVERAADAITKSTKAIMPVHLFSQTADLMAVRELADEYNLRIIEDSAEAIGMRVDGRHAGLWGRAGVLSFFPTKTLGGLGDAGMVLTGDADIAASVRGQRAGGSHQHVQLGLDSQCDELQAAILLTRLERLDADIARRAELAQRYNERLAPLAPALSTPWLAPAKRPSNQVWYVYLIETGRRDELVSFLTEHGVGTEVYYPRPLTEQPCLRDLPGAGHPVPVAKLASQRAVALPLYADLTDAQVDRVCDLVHQFHGGAR
jgi:dTDP-4-amino-4,6-dideoxygalactose transaminase